MKNLKILMNKIMMYKTWLYILIIILKIISKIMYKKMNNYSIKYKKWVKIK